MSILTVFDFEILLASPFQLNHVFRTRDVITKNDAKLSKHRETAREEVMTSDSFLDQGFTRPKVSFNNLHLCCILYSVYLKE